MPRTRWQLTHDCDRNTSRPARAAGSSDGRLLLVVQPALEVRGGIDVHSQEHVGVLRAAVLGALAEEQALLARLEPHLIGASRDQVGLAGQARHPEAVADIGRLQASGTPAAARRLRSAGTCSSLAVMKPRSCPSYLS